MTIKQICLSNGMNVITETLSNVETVALGIWLPRGSRDELKTENGMFHFIEHTLFKGTPTRSAREIAESVEGYGGLLDAYTAKEETCYSIRVRDRHLDSTLVVLADMLMNPAFRAHELDRERQVILEEIKMEEDNPEEVVFEEAAAYYWKGHPLGRPILGPAKNVRRFSAEEVTDFHQRFYTTDQFTVSVAGKFDHDRLCARIEELFPKRTHNQALPRRKSPKIYSSQRYMPHDHYEQINFCLNFEGYSNTDERRHPLLLLTTILGGGMSSRLFQNIREDRGLAYHVGSFFTPYTDCGQTTVYGGCSPENFDQVIGLCLHELKRLKAEPVSELELIRAREQCNTGLVMGLESTSARSSALAREWMTMGRVFDVNQALTELDHVTVDDICEVARDVFRDQTMGLAALGKFDKQGPETSWSVDS